MAKRLSFKGIPKQEADRLRKERARAKARQRYAFDNMNKGDPNVAAARIRNSSKDYAMIAREVRKKQMRK